MRNKRMIIAILSIVLVILIGIGTVCGVAVITSNRNAQKYKDILASAEKYLENEEYDNAILTFKSAIDFQEKEEEAYLQLAVVYYNLGEQQNSYDTLYSCLENVESDRAREFISLYLIEYDSFGLADGSNQQKKDGSDEIAMNKTLIRCFAEYNLEKYKKKYGNPSTNKENQSYVCTHEKIGAKFAYYNTSAEPNNIDTAANKPKEEAKPMQIYVNDLSLIFVGMKEKLTYQELDKLNLTGLKIEKDEDWEHCVVFNYCGCKFRIQSTVDGTIQKTAKNMIQPSARTAVAEKVMLEGLIIDATTGKGVDNVTLVIKDESGTEVEETSTDSKGNYNVQLKSGDYYIEIEKEGWNEETFEVHVNEYEDTTTQDLVITPTIAQGQIRIVLTWGETPYDLDSHLFGRMDDGSSIHTNYIERQSYNSQGQCVAELDVDDTDGYGPETITINDTNGKFKYMVHDYRTTNTMAYSEATVKVYMGGSGAPIEYTVIPSAENDWTVFEIDHGVIQEINSPEATYSVN